MCVCGDQGTLTDTRVSFQDVSLLTLITQMTSDPWPALTLASQGVARVVERPRLAALTGLTTPARQRGVTIVTHRTPVWGERELWSVGDCVCEGLTECVLCLECV